MNMITDRTSQDVERWRELRDKGWSGMSVAEQEEWLGVTIPVPAATKGMYTHNDLNRVESAVEAISVRIRAAGYKLPDLVTKTDWTYQDTVHRDDIARYYGNIETLRSFFSVFADTPSTPTIERKLDYRLANDLEKILVDIDRIFNNITQTWCYTGEVISGEV